jgi:hypothetical protein
MGLGAYYQRVSQKFGHGLRVAWYRDVIRPRILQTSPVCNLTDDTCEIHALTCQSDWLNLLWGLKSFYRYSNRHYKLCIHEDGSLDAVDVSHLQTHFPDARIIRRSDADKLVFKCLENYPRLLDFRQKNLLAPKIVDFVTYLQSDRMLVFDSDILFFSEPTILLQRIESNNYHLNTFNSDFASAYTVNPDEVERLMNFKVLSCFNSGLGLAHKNSIRYDWLEEFLTLPGITDGHFWRIEQTLCALCSSRFGTESLPDEYSLYLNKGIGNRPFRHYVGEIRHLMYKEGISKLCKTGLLSSVR